MATLKESLEIQYSGLAVFASETVLGFKNWLQTMPVWQRFIFLFLVIAIIPAYLGSRIGLSQYMSLQYARNSLVVHPAYTVTMPIKVEKTEVLKNPNGNYSAYAIISNPNLDLAIDNLRYIFDFYNSSNQKINSSSGTTYLLPDEKKWLVISRIESTEDLVKAEVNFDSQNWQKRISLPDIKLRLPEPTITEQTNPLAVVTEGAAINQTEFALKQIRIVIVLYGDNNKVLAVASRDENNLQPFQRRAYKLSWPNLYQNQIKRVELQGYTNTLDSRNISEPDTSNSQSQVLR